MKTRQKLQSKKFFSSLIAIIIFFFGILLIKGFSPKNTTFKSAKVIHVIDGDTLIISGGQHVRLIGINTPELESEDREGECYAQEAKQKNQALIQDKTITLEADISAHDQYGRLLRYAWVGETLINEILVKEGYAKAQTYPPNTKHQNRLNQAQLQAQEQQKGIWSPTCQQ